MIPNLHPVFSHTYKGSLYVQSENAEELHSYLLSCLSQEPDNLRLHVQFIFGLIQKEGVSRDEVFGALLDLFIVLGDKGLPLRQRMLAVAKPFISSEDVTFFQSYLNDGLSGRTVVKDIGFSQFAESYIGQANFIDREVQREDEQVLSTYEEALSLLEYGELDEAAVLLEQALKQEPSKEQIAEELLAIYSHQENFDAIDSVRDWFFEQDLSLPQCWPLL